jgi:signal transduction histidine kinase
MVMAQMNLRIARDAAEAADQAKMQFLSSMSHEIRTPLNAIMGLSQLMSSEAYGELGDPRYHEYVDDIHNAGGHLLSLVSDILDFSRLSANRMDLKEEAVDLEGAAHEAIRMIPSQAQPSGVDIQLEVDQNVPLLHADPRRIKQIIVNLVANAAKFSPEGALVTVRVEIGDDRSIRLHVIDQGRGMSADDIETALSAFGQVEEDGSSGRGTGLGLPITQRLVEAHGGSFRLDSTPGEGTTASVVFPPGRAIDRVA